MAGTNGDVEILSSARNVGSKFLRGEGVRSTHGSPYATVDGALVERSCPWTRTVRGFLNLVGHPDDGRWGLGEERLGRHCVVRCSPRAKRS